MRQDVPKKSKQPGQGGEVRRRVWREMMKDGAVWSRGGTLDSLGTVNARPRLDDLGPQAVSSRGVMCSELSFQALKTAVLQRWEVWEGAETSHGA